MTTIAELQRKLKAWNIFAKKASQRSGAEAALQSKWTSLFSEPLSNSAAITFVKYYREMRGNTTRKQSGGMAPLSYQMTPGANVSVYGRFPVEVDTDMGSIRDLDVYFRDSLSAGCGTENSSLTVPVEMGSNQVGGKKARKSRNVRKTKRNTRNARKTMRKMKTSRRNRVTRRMRGGADWWDYRPYWASVPPNAIEQVSSAYAGVEPPASGNPTDHSWNYKSSGATDFINPASLVTNIKSDLSLYANPAPWQVGK